MSVVQFHNKSTRKKEPKSITGRDAYLVAKALAYAIEVIAALPATWEEWCDREDMEEILGARFPGFRKVVTEKACHQLFHPKSPLIRYIDMVEDDQGTS
jgi:hypothetical protein